MEEFQIKQIVRLSLREHVYGILQRAIVSGELKPGQRLRDLDLATQLGVSRTPVREALQRLEDEGLVETKPGSLTRVMPLDTRAASETIPVVAALHALAARLGVARVTSQHLEAMRAANVQLAAALKAQDVGGAIRADDAFHLVLVRAAGNREIEQTLDHLTPKIRRLEWTQFGSLAGRRSVRQHEGIIDACDARDGRDARGVAMQVENNWLSLGQLILAAFEQRQPPSLVEEGG